jgi:DNA-binding NtrC family response regulator
VTRTGERDTATRISFDAMRGSEEGVCLLVMSESGVYTFPLPAGGEVRIGRSERCAIVVSDPQLSREHACIRVDGDRYEVIDLGSSNGTRIGNRELAPHEAVGLEPGELIALGTTVIVLQAARRTPHTRHLLSHASFEDRLERACERSREGLAGPFAVMRLRLQSSDAARRLHEVLGRVLVDPPVVGSYALNEYEVLASYCADWDGADELARRVATELAAGGARAEVGAACYPRDGRTAQALMALAGERSRAEAVPPDGAPGKTGDRRNDRGPDSSAPPHAGALDRLRPMVERFAAGVIPVLVLGETGVGKEVLATMLHALSPRASKPLVCLNCAALPEALLESELFGHERGAYTGAVQTKPGILESAKGGTVLLDEVAEMPLSVQAKLLRVIDQREVLRLGTTTPRPIDVRFIAATNRDLEAEVARGTFRSDLYYRLNAAQIVIPPLRQRRDEIAPLARTFVRVACRRAARSNEPRLSADALALLMEYSWPGNVRELRNVIERAVLLATGDMILPEHLPTERIGRKLEGSGRQEDRPGALDEGQASVASDSRNVRVSTLRPRIALPGLDPDEPTLVDNEEQAKILRVLQECDFNQTRAAERLGISRRTLVSRLASYGWTRPRRKN